MPKYRNANTNAGDFREYVYAVELLTGLLAANIISESEFKRMKQSFMDEYRVSNDWACRRKITAPATQIEARERTNDRGTKKTNSNRV